MFSVVVAEVHRDKEDQGAYLLYRRGGNIGGKVRTESKARNELSKN